MKIYILSGDMINDKKTMDALTFINDGEIFVFYNQSHMMSFDTFILLKNLKTARFFKVDDRESFLVTLGFALSSISKDVEDAELYQFTSKEYALPKYITERFGGKTEPSRKRKKKTFSDDMNPPEEQTEKPEVESKPKKQPRKKKESLLDDTDMSPEETKAFNVVMKDFNYPADEKQKIGCAIKKSVLCRRGPASMLFEEFGEEKGRTITEQLKPQMNQIREIFK